MEKKMEDLLLESVYIPELLQTVGTYPQGKR